VTSTCDVTSGVAELCYVIDGLILYSLTLRYELGISEDRRGFAALNMLVPSLPRQVLGQL